MTAQAAPAHIIIATLTRPNGATGVHTHQDTVLEHLRSAGRAGTLLTPFSAGSPALYPVFAARLPIRRVSRPAGVWWYRHWHAVFLQQALRARLRSTEPAVVYAQCPVSAAAALRVRDAQPVVLAVHFNVSQADEWALRGQLRAGGRLYRSIRAFEADVLPRLDGLVYVSEFARLEVESRIPGARTVPATVIHHAVDRPSRPPVARTRDLVTVGSLEPRKNQAYLLEVLAAAARRGHRYTLTIVGDGPDRDRLERTVRRLGLQRQVELLGPHPDPGVLLPAHRLYCHTALVESFGIAVLEAMSVGVPVLAGRVGGIPEIVRAEQDGDFWPLDDAESAADILIGLLEDPATLTAMGGRAAERAARQFSVEAMGTKLLGTLDGAALHGGR